MTHLSWVHLIFCCVFSLHCKTGKRNCVPAGIELFTDAIRACCLQLSISHLTVAASAFTCPPCSITLFFYWAANKAQLIWLSPFDFPINLITVKVIVSFKSIYYVAAKSEHVGLLLAAPSHDSCTTETGKWSRCLKERSVTSYQPQL